MSKITDNLRAAYQEVQEKLKGDQHKLDHDGDGDIDGKDFAMLRAKKKKKEKVDEAENVNELSPDKMKQYRKKAAIDIVKRDAQKDIATARFKRDHPHMDVDTTDHDAKTKMRKGYRKLAKAKMMSAEAYEGVPAATHKGYQDPQGVGLSPSAKAQLAKKTPTPEPTDAPKVNDKNFKDFRKGLKTAAKRNGDNAKGDKTIISPATKA